MKKYALRAIASLWKERVRFAKYATVGTLSVNIDIATLILLVEWLKINPTIAVVCNQIVVLGCNFLCNKYWSFQSNGKTHQELVRYLILASWNYTFAVMAMYVGNGLLGGPYLVVRVLSIMCMVSWNFMLYRWWVYRQVGERASR